MIRALRQRHRRAFAVLALVLPGLFVAAVAGRKPAPVTGALPPGIEAKAQSFSQLEWTRDDVFPKNRIRARLLRERPGSGSFAIQLAAPQDFSRPDVIVYWTETDTANTDELPAGATLLGALDSVVLPLPKGEKEAAGQLILFSLADNEVIEVSQPIRPGKP